MVQRARLVGKLLLILVLGIGILGCESGTTTKEAESSSETTLSDAVATKALEGFDIPDNDATALIQFMSDVVSQPPEGESDTERTEFVGKQMDARIVAAERLQKIAESDDHRIVAARTKLESLRVLGMIGRPDGVANFTDFAESLANSDIEQISRVGRIGGYQSLLDNFLTNGDRDASPIVAALGKLIKAEGSDRPVFDTANETAMALQQVGLPEPAGEVYRLIADNFADHEEADLAEAAENAGIQAQLASVGKQFARTMGGEEGAADELQAAISSALDSDSIDQRLLGPLLNVVRNLEYSGNVEPARKIYELLGENTSKIADDEIKKQVEAAVRGGTTRVGLIGKPFELTGRMANGDEFDWSAYKDKVVLVDYWATWCGPCLAEVPNVRKNYDAYHDDGFEVVGVNLDDERSRVDKFLEANPLPWSTVVSDDDEALGFKDENAARYNVEAIPFLVLVGRDGNVDSLHLRGELLDRRLAEIFGASDAATATESSQGIESADGDDAAQDVAESDGEVEMDVVDSGEESEEAAMELEATETLPPTAPAEPQVNLDANPYLADDSLAGADLMMYLLELADKPKSIQRRPGFRDAIVDAVDRVLDSSENEKHCKLAAQKKLEFLHRDAQLGDDEAQQQLTEFVQRLSNEMPEPMSKEVEFFDLEQRALIAEQGQDVAEEALLDECCDYLKSEGEALDGKHLRLASTTVELVNQLEAEQREPYFERISEALLQSKDREVARYGKRLAKSEDALEKIIGQTFELAGITTDGNTFDIQHYRQDIVVVDFWATWCGPCRKAHPKVIALAEKHADLRIVSVSLDADEEALAEFLKEHEMPGVTLYGKEAQEAARRYAVRGIPTFFVLDGDGKIQHVTNNPDGLDKEVGPLIKTRLADNQ